MRAWIIIALALAASSPARAEPRNPLDGLKLDSLAATRDRPLFAPSRRPPPVPVKAEAPPPPPVVAEKPVETGPPPFDLIGSVVGRGASYALLRDHATAKVLRLKPGEEAQGWRVGAIAPRGISLERDGRSESLALIPTSPAGDAPPQVANVGDEDGQPPPVEARPALRRRDQR